VRACDYFCYLASRRSLDLFSKRLDSDHCLEVEMALLTKAESRFGRLELGGMKREGYGETGRIRGVQERSSCTSLREDGSGRLNLLQQKENRSGWKVKWATVTERCDEGRWQWWQGFCGGRISSGGLHRRGLYFAASMPAANKAHRQVDHDQPVTRANMCLQP
jgi:hypothetical protein